jgi:hypothetical protein
LNVTIHHQWATLFALHMNSKFQIPTYNNADVPNIMDYENIIYFIAPSQNFHPFDLFKDKHLEKLNFPTLFYGQLRQFSKVFSCQQMALWELFHKSRDFSTNIFNFFLNLLKFPSKKS